MIKRVLITLKNNKFYSLAAKRSFVKFFQRNYVINCLIIYFICLVIFLFYKYSVNFNSLYEKFNEKNESDSEILEVTNLKHHNETVASYLKARKDWDTSKLGTLLFKNQNNSFHQKDKTFVVLVWKYWNWLKSRHIDNYGPPVRHAQDALTGCSVNNCVFTGNNKRIETADAVIIHIMHGKLPEVSKRNPKQIWVFLNDEAPTNAFSLADSRLNLKDAGWTNIFNWSMTYRSNADVPVPYGRTIPLEKPVMTRVTFEAIAELIPNLQFKRTDVLVAVLISNCGVEYRTKFLKEFQKYIKVDVYGQCGTDSEKKSLCRGHFKRDCPLLDQYYFYLVMENSKCSQYITEKTFHNAYTKGAIPILVGTFKKDAKELLPPNSFIYANDFETYKHLAETVNSTIQNIREYLSYHLWRNHFAVRNEHGYFGTKSYHFCRMCEALNYNEGKKKIITMNKFMDFLDHTRLCLREKVLLT